MPRITRLASGIIAAALLAVALPSAAMTGLSVKFQRLMLSDGLSQSSILSLHQDSRGFIWLGTQDGLNRYDGRQIVTFKSDPENPDSISDVNIWCIAEDARGNLWLGTEGGGFNRFNRNDETFTPFRNGGSGQKGNYDVRAILVDRKGIVWVGTMEHGLVKYDPDTASLTEFRHDPADPSSLPGNQVRALLQDWTGALWVGTSGGLARLDPETGSLKNYRNDPRDPLSPPTGEILTLAASTRGGIWVGGAAGFGYFDPDGGSFRKHAVDPEGTGRSLEVSISAIQEVSGRQLWLGSEHRGVYQIDLDTGHCRAFQHNPQDPASLSDNEIYSIRMDRAGVLWIGSSNGANRMDTKAKQFYHLSNQRAGASSLSNACVWSMWETRDGKVWMVTEAGLNILDPATDHVTQVRAESGDQTRPSYDSFIEVVEDSLGGIWLGARDGALNRYDPATGLYRRFPPDPGDPQTVGDDRIFAVCGDRRGGVWIGTWSGLERYDLATGRFQRFRNDPADTLTIPAGSVRDLYVDAQDRVWMSIWGDGAACLDQATGRFRQFHHDPADRRTLSSNVVLSVMGDSRGRLWLGTTTGLNLLDQDTGHCRRYTMQDGLPNNTIYRVEEDAAARLWVSTNFGLSRFDPESGAFSNFVERDGIQDNEFNMGSSHNGRSGLMYFGGINGLTAFYPDSIRSNPYVPEVALTDFRIFNKPVPLGPGPNGRVVLDRAVSEVEHIELNHTDHVISFEFSVLHFASPLKNNFSYLMEGFETEWNDVGNRNHATYTNLPPGNYTFRVKGSNNDGLWNEEGRSITIHVSPPFYQRAWFLLAVVLSAGGLIYGAHRYRTRLLDVKNKVLERRVAERTEDLTAANSALQLEIGVRQRIEDELREARNNAVAATRAKSEFLANMSHEIRTPMNGVLGMTSILLDTELEADQREYAEAIYASANNLLIIINDILDFSKIEAGKLHIESIEFDLLDVMDRVTEMLAYKAQEKGLHFSCAIDPRAPRFLRGDPGRVTQILINLANNAVKFTMRGSVQVRVEMLGWSGGRAELAFAVSDTGVGIPEDRLDTIFESFTQVDASVTRKFGGTGLGLTIVKQLSGLMAGEVSVESREGEGATFRFTVQMDAQNQDVPVRAQGRVLVVHEDGATSQALCRQLAYLGYQGTATPMLDSAAVFARAAAGGRPFDWVFLADSDNRRALAGMILQLTHLASDGPWRGVLLCRLGKAVNQEELQELGLEAYLTVPAHHAKLEALLEGRTAEAEPELPAVPPGAPGQGREPGPAPEAVGSGPAAGGQGPLVLLAEDNPINQKVAGLLLKKLGYRVDVAANGLEVLEAVARKDYAAILLDVQMPEMDGLEAARRIRGEGSPARNPRIPIIALTAHAMAQDRQRSLDAGMDEHVSKPIETEIIARVLAEQIARSAQNGSPVSARS